MVQDLYIQWKGLGVVGVAKLPTGTGILLALQLLYASHILPHQASDAHVNEHELRQKGGECCQGTYSCIDPSLYSINYLL